MAGDAVHDARVEAVHVWPGRSAAEPVADAVRGHAHAVPSGLMTRQLAQAHLNARQTRTSVMRAGQSQQRQNGLPAGSA